MFYVYIILAFIFVSLPFCMVKQYSITKKWYYILFAILGYSILTFLYSQMLDNQDISCIYPVLNIVSILTVFLIGILVFKEEINIFGILGIIFSFITIFLFLASSYIKKK